MKKETFIYFAVTTLIILLGFYILATKAKASERRSLRAHCYFLEDSYSCRQRLRKRHYYIHHRPSRRTYEERYYRAPEAYDNSPRCKASMAREGLEKYDIKEAKESAQSMAMEAIRNHHGVKYMDPANWERVEYSCGVSSTGNRGSEKTAEIAGRTLKQCTIYLRPCRTELSRD